MAVFSERLKYLMEANGTKLKELSAYLDVGISTIGAWREGRNEPKYNMLDKIATYYQVTVGYLVGSENVQPCENTPHLIPIINFVQAGKMTDISDIPYTDMETMPLYEGFNKNCFALKVVGDSMSPKFNEGDIIVIDPDKEPKTGDYVVASTSNNESATFKKYKKRYKEDGTPYIELNPLNPDYEPINSNQFDIVIKGVLVYQTVKY